MKRDNKTLRKKKEINIRCWSLYERYSFQRTTM